MMRTSGPAKKGISIGLKLLAGATASVAIIVGCTVGLVIGLHSEMPGVSFSEVPGSRYHSRGDCGPCCRMIDGSAATCGNVATWWGHNMAKLARGAEGTLYSGYLDNSRALPTMSEFVMLRKTRQGAWEEGKRLPASRPANILIDRNGNVHVLAFEPTNVSVSDFVGTRTGIGVMYAGMSEVGMFDTGGYGCQYLSSGRS